jgi:hypothetical protein
METSLSLSICDESHSILNKERQTTMERTANPRQLVLQSMHWWFLTDMVLVSIAGIQLFLLSGLTDRFFAWTIQSALTAAFLGAAYFCTLPMLFASYRAREWVQARIAVPGVWLFTGLTTIATFQHWDKFHWNSPLLTARLAFWVWLVVYLGVPIGLGIAWYIQQRVPGVEPERQAPMQRWFRILLGAQTAVILLLGIALFLFPGVMVPLWMWALTPLTSAAIGAWLIGIGITLAWAIWENDWQRLSGTMLTYALLGVLQLIAVARFGGQMNWNSPNAWLYLAFLVSVVLMGGLGSLFARRATP